MHSFKFLAPWKGFGKSETKDEECTSRALSKMRGKVQLLATKSNPNENIFDQHRRHSSCIVVNTEWNESNYTSTTTPIVPLHSSGKENFAGLKREKIKADAFESRHRFRQVPSNLRGKVNQSTISRRSQVKEEDADTDNLVEARNNAIHLPNLYLHKTVNVNCSNGSSTSVEHRPVPFPRKPGIFYQFGEKNDECGRIADDDVISIIPKPRKGL